MNAIPAKRATVPSEQMPESMQVLVVEDSAPERFLLTHLLGRQGHGVLQAADGYSALEILESNIIDLVICDWQMPGLDGLGLCQRIRTHDRYGHPHVIMLTGRQGSRDLVKAIEAGADDYMTKPAVADELRVRMAAGMRGRRLRRLLESQNNDLKLILRRESQLRKGLQTDIDAAAAMQLEYLPRNHLHDGLQYAYLYRPASGVSGDGLGVFQLDTDHIGFFILDVCGHGVASGMHAISVGRRLSPYPKQDSILYTEDGRVQRPDRVVEKLNRIYSELASDEPLVTLAYGVLQVSTGLGQLCLAGHPHPIRDHSCDDSDLTGTPGLPIGVDDAAEYVSTPFELPLNSHLLLYTDGLIERGTSVRERHEYQTMLSRLIVTQPQPTPQALCRRLEDWMGKAPLKDDVSALVIRRIDHG